jgi:hypothetical protein
MVLGRKRHRMVRRGDVNEMGVSWKWKATIKMFGYHDIIGLKIFEEGSHERGIKGIFLNLESLNRSITIFPSGINVVGVRHFEYFYRKTSSD